MKPIVRPLSALLMCGIYLLSIFFSIPYAPIIISTFALIVLISFFPYLERTPKILIFFLAILAISIDTSGEGLYLFFNGLQTNVNVLTIFLFVPLLSIPIQQKNYLKYIEIIFSYYIHTTQRLYLFTTLSLISLGSVMNLGAVPILYQLTNSKSFQPFEVTRIKALSRGFAMTFMWSPYFVSISLVISYFNVSWIQIFPISFSIAIVGVILGLILEGKNKQNIPVVDYMSFKGEDLKVAKIKLLELIVIIVSITSIIMITENILALSVLTIIPIISIFFTIIWLLIITNVQGLMSGLFSFFQTKVSTMGNELSLFIIAGAFGAVLINNGADLWIIFLLELLNISNVLLLIPLLALLIVVPAMVGIHPVITIATLSITLSELPMFNNDHLLLSFSLLASWMVAVVSSPFSGLNLIISGVTKRGLFEIGLKNNFLFSLILWGICYLVIVILYLFNAKV